MTLQDAVRERQARRAVKANRTKNEAAGRRVDEIATVAEVETDYRRVDRVGDLQMESWFQRHYAAQKDEAGRSDVTEGFLLWQRTERAEESEVSESVNGSLTLMRENNPFWLGEG